MIAGATTDNKGYFYLNDVPYGNYMLRVSLIGFATRYVKDISLNADNSVITVRSLELASNAALEEVVVTAEKDLIVQELVYLERQA